MKRSTKAKKAEIRTALQALLDKEYTEDGQTMTGAEQLALALFQQAKDITNPHCIKAMEIITKLTDTSPKEQLELEAIRYQLTKATAPANSFDIMGIDDYEESTKENIRQRLVSL